MLWGRDLWKRFWLIDISIVWNVGTSIGKYCINDTWPLKQVDDAPNRFMMRLV